MNMKVKKGLPERQRSQVIAGHPPRRFTGRQAHSLFGSSWGWGWGGGGGGQGQGLGFKEKCNTPSAKILDARL